MGEGRGESGRQRARGPAAWDLVSGSRKNCFSAWAVELTVTTFYHCALRLNEPLFIVFSCWPAFTILDSSEARSKNNRNCDLVEINKWVVTHEQ